MTTRDFTEFAKLSPFELKDHLIEIASSDAQRIMLNAGRGNPNFLATLPRWAFLSLGDFSLRESERSYSYLNSGFGGLPEHDGIVQRFEAYANDHRQTDGVIFLRSAISYVKDQLGLDRDSFLYEMVSAFLGCNYPTPPRMLEHTEQIVKAYLTQEMFGAQPKSGDFSLFATEGGTAAMAYILQTLHENGLIHPGDKIAIATPIFSPYLEIPVLSDYQLEVVDIRMDEHADWQFPEAEIAKLKDPAVKLFCLVNPSNPPSTKLSDASLDQLAGLVGSHRPDLMIITDDVYGTFADDFVSLYAKCPHNTLCVYSFSKFFGATGWRLGAIALHNENAFDLSLAALPEPQKILLDKRYSSLTTTPRKLPFIDRLVADSRAVALNHTAGLSVPQQVQMVLFSLFALMDTPEAYKNALKRLIRGRKEALYREIGISFDDSDENQVDYYTIIDLEFLGNRAYGPEFVTWLFENTEPSELLFRLAKEARVVLLPGRGFGTQHPSGRVSLANLNESDYKAIGRAMRKLMVEYVERYNAATGKSLDKNKVL